MVGENNGNGDTATGGATEVDKGFNATGDVVSGERGSGGSVLHRLYVGTGAFDVVGRRRRWYLMFAALVLICIAAIGIRGFNFGIDFVGGTQIQFPGQGASSSITTEEAASVYNDVIGQPPEEVQQVGTGNLTSVQIRSETLEPQQVTALKQAVFEQLQPLGTNGEPTINAISVSEVSASWGDQISQQALIALGVFLVLVTIFLALYFERWMAVAALIALLHDVLVTAGVYALVGLEVTPATVIGLLTILGFSLYDTVVVFDKVRENTRGLLGLSRRTYGEAANLALNQTLMRSINTSVIAALPVLGLLVVGYLLLGAGVLQQLALVQLVGLIAGVLSSVLLATPLLVTFKMRGRQYQEQAARVYGRRAKLRGKQAGQSEDSGVGGMDSDEMGDALRQEKALAAAAAVPARHPKSTPQRHGKPTGKRKR